VPLSGEFPGISERKLQVNPHHPACTGQALYVLPVENELETPKERDHSGNLDVNGKIILKRI
jgi:hypothetical protein